MISLERGHGTRNGVPERSGYVRKAPRPGWALRAIAAAEAEHGPPEPVCRACGLGMRNCWSRCRACGAAQ